MEGIPFFLCVCACVVQTLANLNVAQAVYRVTECTFGDTTSESTVQAGERNVKVCLWLLFVLKKQCILRGSRSTSEGRCVCLQLYSVLLEISCKKVHAVRGFFFTNDLKLQRNPTHLNSVLFVHYHYFFCFVSFRSLFSRLCPFFLPSARYLLYY